MEREDRVRIRRTLQATPPRKASPIGPEGLQGTGLKVHTMGSDKGMSEPSSVPYKLYDLDTELGLSGPRFSLL